MEKWFTRGFDKYLIDKFHRGVTQLVSSRPGEHEVEANRVGTTRTQLTTADDLNCHNEIFKNIYETVIKLEEGNFNKCQLTST